MKDEKEKYFLLFSTLLDYPNEGSVQFAEESTKSFSDLFPEAYQYLKSFSIEAKKLSVSNLEELYTRTFDIQGRACLDVGYLLFGEDYKRGEFLVNIKGLAREHHIETGVELPDHLTNILKLLSKIDEESRKELCEKVIMPALDKILAHFGTDVQGEDLYVGHLLGLQSYLNQNYKINNLILGAPAC